MVKVEPQIGQTPRARGSAGRDVFSFPEIRQQIIRHLDKPDLASLIRVQKLAMYDVATELYASMPYARVRSRMSMATPRQRTYLLAVREIDAQSEHLKLAPAMLEQTGLVITNRQQKTLQTTKYLEAYHPEVFTLCLPPMRKKCAGLRRMLFGTPYRPFGADSWVAHVDPDSAPDEVGTGHIEFHRTLKLNLNTDPPSTVDAPLPPCDGYTMLPLRFDLHLNSFGLHWPKPKVDEWLAALRSNACFGQLYRAIDFDIIPVSLDDIASLYQRQSARGYPDRLETVIGDAVQDYTPHDFRRFARVASSSLRFLRLAREDRLRGPGRFHSKIDFAELPSIFPTIRNDLPNLKALDIAINGMENAEEACLGLLTPRSLEAGGTIDHLHIYGANSPVSEYFFNFLRYIACICTPEAWVAVDMDHDRNFDPEGHDRYLNCEQTDYLRYLPKLPRKSRMRLANIDFSLLGVTRLRDVFELHFHPDGSPWGLWERDVKEVEYSRRIQEARNGRAPLVIKREPELKRCKEAAEQLEAKSSTGNTAQMLKLARKLEKALEDAEDVLDEDLGDELASTISWMEDASDPQYSPKHDPNELSRYRWYGTRFW